MRAGELFYLEWNDVDFKSRIIKIQSKPNFHPKTYEIRSIPINDELYRVLRAIPRGKRYVFDDGFGNHLFQIDSALRYLKRVIWQNGIPEANLYTFRHTFGSQLVMAGVDLVTVKELMRHASITTTEKYLHVNNESRIRTAVDRLKFCG